MPAPDEREDHLERPEERLSLGEYLAVIRNNRRMSLRAVEDKTNKQVSNAYLSQIETGKIQQPSPNILHALAEAYEISFDQLMENAGYIKPSTPRSKTERHGRAATFAELNLTLPEERELLQYLEFIRKRDADK